ncbi:MAG: universal stress protein [Gemmatimonadetes bacterium]|nr:universal stress protein [Gemmatimonadota bacterium]MBI3568543.1 universal stress protein [Gemmatimonadota bacterium]
MYRRILVPLENSRTDDAIVAHVTALARQCGASLVFIHVADGFVARNLTQLDLRESDEIRKDRAYLDAIVTRITGEGFKAEAVLASGEPAKEICAAADREGCDLIAMGTHGHRLVKDILYGSVANEVRHNSMVPVLMVREPQPDA